MTYGLSVAFPVRGVIFDFDGTLYGDWKIWTRLITETLQEFQVRATVEESWEKAQAMIKEGVFYNISGVAIALAREHGVLLKDLEVRKSFLDRLDVVMDKDGPSPVLVQLLDRLQAENVKMGIVTFQRILRLRRRLETWKLIDYFSSLVTPDEMAEFKPSPVPFSKAINELGVRPSECVVVGDEPVDMIGAVKAGAWTIGLPNGFFSRQQLLDSGARQIVGSVRELAQLLAPFILDTNQ